jgi:hypothetical protein
MNFSSFHGTSSGIAQKLCNNNISVALGGGELGRGFYSGELLHEAKAWAKHRFGDYKKNVVVLTHRDDDFFSLDSLVMNANQASLKRLYIRSRQQARTYLFNVDLVWAPIVGSSRVSGEQYKWESSVSEKLLNSPKTVKKTV